MAAVNSPSQRQYHKTSSAYVLPNDCSAVEQDRLDAQAAAIVTMIGGVPILTPGHLLASARKIADVGCGTGVATIQLANMFPTARAYGIDISPVPEAIKAIAPKNVEWVQGDILDTDSQKPGADFIKSTLATSEGLNYLFGRMLFLGINDWLRYFKTCSQLLRSGGIVEHQDLDWNFYRVGTGECLSGNWEWHRAVLTACRKTGLLTSAGSSAAAHMREAGLDVITTQTFEFSFVPSKQTPDSQAMGRYVQAKLIPHYPELLRKMLSSLDITSDKLATLTQDCLRDLASEEGIHQRYTITIARKP
ncbi:S-adenosyl-L-methionine-dependent methyltransferase [Xylariaceae sp. AK1471]|nr:S-adenosyl-L-methionine-dependent methyltransferase [Xylariaceae sp. AK1471]